MVESIESRSRKLDVSNAIEAVTINEFKSIIYDHKGAAFSKFLLLAVGIEYLGACLDDFPFDEPKESENRFNSISDVWIRRWRNQNDWKFTKINR